MFLNIVSLPFRSGMKWWAESIHEGSWARMRGYQRMLVGDYRSKLPQGGKDVSRRRDY
jgi:hypothetical protein